MILYHCHDARSFRVLWALEELGLPYELRILPFPPRMRAREYLKENPLGTIPLFLDGETRMTESPAIVQYLAARYGNGALSVRLEEEAFGAYLNALSFGEATLTFPQTLVLRYSVLEPEGRRQPQVVEDYARWFAARLAGVTPDKSGFIAAGRFTAADICVGYALMLSEKLGLAGRFPDTARTYWEGLATRPAFRKAKASQAAAAQAQGIADWSAILSPPGDAKIEAS